MAFRLRVEATSMISEGGHPDAKVKVDEVNGLCGDGGRIVY